MSAETARERINQAIDAKDWATVIGIAMHASASAAEGHYCECPEPDVCGFDLMCGVCGLENRVQIQKREAAYAAPHQYVAGRHDDIGMCDFCTGWRDDPRHVADPAEWQKEADHA
jgi:hypothetical protein